MSKRLTAALRKEYRFGDFGLGTMSLGAFLESRPLRRKSKHVRYYARRRTNYEYKKLATPNVSYTVWWEDAETGCERGIDVPASVYKWVDVPASEGSERGW